MREGMNVKALGVNVKYYREQKDLTANRLAEMADVSLSHIKNIESASVNASAKVLVQIANALEEKEREEFTRLKVIKKMHTG